METDRPQLYYFLLPFTIISLILYALVLVEIYRKRAIVMYDSLFFRLTCSQSVYDISYVIMYFVMELPQDWPALYPFYFAMNDTIVPQLIYAHVFVCFIAQILGVTTMSVSRMLLVCHPAHKLTKMLKCLSRKQVVFCHCIVPFTYALYVVIGQSWRYYGFIGQSTRIARLGNQDSVTINSHVTCLLGIASCCVSGACYTRIFTELRRRPVRSWRWEFYIIATSFVLFCALCTLTAYFATSLYCLYANRTLYFALRNHIYAFTFFLSLANPWCLMISSVSIRSAVLRRCLPSTRLTLLGTATSEGEHKTTTAPPSQTVTMI